MESETSWVLDSLVGFLQGPIWNIPINSFIEQRSIVFEPEYEDESDVQGEVCKTTREEREQEYRKIFREYGDLVDRLLSAHMEDLNISLESFEEACVDVKGNFGAKFQRTLFEQIWAANDFEIFKAMMVKRNIELHIQAMNILTSSLIISDSSEPEQSNKILSFLIDDDALLEQVMKLSLEEAKGEEDTLDDQIKQDVLRIAVEERGRLEAERDKEQIKLDRALKRVMATSPVDHDSDEDNENHDTQVKSLGSLRKYKRLKSSDDEENETGSIKESHKNEANEIEDDDDDKKLDDDKTALLKPKAPSVAPEEIRARQEYLRRRRDKIIETKRKERQKQVHELEEKEIKEQRPKSAKAIRSVFDQDGQSEDKEDKGLSFRRSLAAKLKAQVIEKKE